MSHFRATKLFLLAFVVCGISLGLRSPVSSAQPESPAVSKPAESRAETAPLPTTGDIIYLKDETGRLVPVPLNASLKEYLDWIEKTQAEPANPTPPFSLDAINLTGSAADESAELEAEIQIQVRESDTPVKVPLQFNEAVLKEVEYTGEGQYAFAGFQAKNGYQWWLTGSGRHVLRLKFSVPIRKQLQSRRLQLTLPRSAVGSLELTVPLPNAAFRVPERSAFEVKSTADSTSVTLFGLGENFDLGWQPAAETRTENVSLQAVTRIKTDLRPGAVILEATQQISSIEGSFQHVEVRLPPQFERQSLEIKGNQLEGISQLENRPGWYRVSLASPTSEAVELLWTLTQKLPDDGGRFQIEGFELGGDVLQQSGEISLSRVPGYRIQELDRNAVFRRDSTPSEDQQTVTRAYQFFRQPFRLAVELQKIRPLFTCDPQFDLKVLSESVQLTANFNLQLHRGTLEQIELIWPEWDASGWRISPIDQTGLIEKFVSDPAEPNRLRAVFFEPQSAKQLQIAFNAEHPFATETTPQKILLPRLAERGPQKESNVSVSALENLKVTVSAVSDLSSSRSPLKTEVANRFRRLGSYQFRSGKSPILEIAAVPQERAVTTTSRVELESRAGMSLTVSQSVNYAVEYERLQTLRFRVAAEVAQTVRCYDEQNRELEVLENDSDLNAPAQIRVVLPQPMLGTFAVRLEFPISLAEHDESEPIPVPIALPSDGEIAALELTLPTELAQRYRPTEGEWELLSASPTALEFKQRGQTSLQQIRLEQRFSDSTGPQQLTVEKSLFLCFTDGNGQIRTRCYFELAGPLSTIEVEIPAQYEVDRINLNQQSLPAESWSIASNQLSISVEKHGFAAAPGTQLLSIDLYSDEQTVLGWQGELTCAVPQLLNARRSYQTMWQIDLPYRQHLFLPPENVTPQNQWYRNGLFWERAPQMSLPSLANWISVDPSELSDLYTARGNTYLFHDDFGNLESVKLGTMSRSFVVLIGAGSTLILSFLLLKLPATQNVLTLLLIALGLAIGGIWYPTSVALLLQPAALGFCLALLAAYLDRMFRRPHSPAIVTFSDPVSAGEHPGSSQASLALSPPVLGSENPTEMRPRDYPQEKLSSYLGSE